MLFQVLDSIEHCVMFGFGRDDMTRLRRGCGGQAARWSRARQAKHSQIARLRSAAGENNFMRFDA